MKTIQQIISEMDPHKIEDAYFMEHPIEIPRVKDFDDMTIARLQASFYRTVKTSKEKLASCQLFLYN